MKKNGKKVLKIIGIILGVILVLVAINMTANTIANNKNMELAASFKAVENENVITPVKDADGNWTFTTDRELKVMHLTDIHIGGGWISAKNDAKAVNAVAAMVTAEKPDLVVISGDIVYPVPYEAGAINNLPPAKIFAKLMETLGVSWVVTFGNHDTEFYSFYTREEISDFYSNEDFKHCLYQEGPESIDGYGNSVINVKNSEGVITQSIFTMDSHAYAGKGLASIIAMKYDHLKQSQVDWYKATIEKNNAYNKELTGSDENVVNTLLFIHIPIEEYKVAWFEYVNNGYEDTDDVKLIYGTAGEEGDVVVYSGEEPDQLFETMLTLPGQKGIFCGHDHLNNFSIDYKGIRLTYGFSIDYIAYADIDTWGSQRGCTIITVNTDGTFECKTENYYQDKYAHDAREEVTMQVLNADHK